MPARKRRLAPVTDAPTRVVLYIRVSALMGRGGDDFHSPDLQRGAVERHVTPLGMRIVGEIVDIDASGRSFSREGVNELRRMVEAGEVDAVGLYDLSRLGRNVLESLTFIGWLRERGVTVLSTKEQIDDTPTGQFMLAQFLALAQLQSDQIGQRWAEIVDARRRQGIQHGTAPIGYVKAGKKLAVHPVLGPAVREVFRRYAEGWRVADITTMLCTAAGRRIDRRIVKALLRNPVYVGKVTIGGDRGPVHRRVVGEGIHEPLCTPETWQAVQDRVERDRTEPPRTLAVAHALVGVTVCDLCGRTLKKNDEYTKRGVVTKRVFCQNNRKHFGDYRCPGVGTPRLDLIEAEVLRQVGVYLGRLQSDHVTQLQHKSRRAQAGVDVKTLEVELSKTQTALAKLAAAWARDVLTDVEHAAASKELRDAEQLLRTRIAEVRPIATSPMEAESVAAMEALLRLWPDLTVPERNMAVRRVVRQVRVRRRGKDEPAVNWVDVEFL